METKFNKRAFVSLITFFLSISVLVTGVLLYVLPHSDDLKVLGLDPHGWAVYHMVVSLYFVVIVIFHIIENWKTMLSYMKAKADKNFRYKKELLGAFIVSIFITIGSFTSSPVSKVLDIFEPISVYLWPDYVDKHKDDVDKH